MNNVKKEFNPIKEQIQFVIVPSYITECVDKYLKPSDLLCLDTLGRILSNDQLEKFKQLNQASCVNIFDGNYSSSNPLIMDLFNEINLYHDTSRENQTNDLKSDFYNMSALSDGPDVDAILKTFEKLAANYCQRFEVKVIGAGIYGLFLKEMELIEAHEIGTSGTLDELKTRRFIDDITPLIDSLCEIYPVENVLDLELFSIYSLAYSNVR